MRADLGEIPDSHALVAHAGPQLPLTTTTTFCAARELHEHVRLDFAKAYLSACAALTGSNR